MDITFSLQNGQYIAEFKVTSEFNLHIEKGVGSMQMLQRTSGTFFDKVEDFKMEKGDVVYDFDSGSFIGEKTIRLVSSVEPRYCFITTSGEVTEIKAQSKEVEVTANGTMDITPDAGFSYLNSVKVKTNVAGSGEGGSGIEDIYLDASAIYDSDYGMLISAYKRRLDSNGAIVFVPRGLGDNPYLAGEDIACVIMSNTPFTNLATGELSTAGEAMLEQEASGKVSPRITKEQFYNLNA